MTCGQSININLGWGMSRAYELQSDEDTYTTMTPISLLKNQQASAVIVYHATDNIHVSLDYMHGQAKWFLGEQQKFDFINTGAVRPGNRPTRVGRWTWTPFRAT